MFGQLSISSNFFALRPTGGDPSNSVFVFQCQDYLTPVEPTDFDFTLVRLGTQPRHTSSESDDSRKGAGRVPGAFHVKRSERPASTEAARASSVSRETLAVVAKAHPKTTSGI